MRIVRHKVVRTYSQRSDREQHAERQHKLLEERQQVVLVDALVNDEAGSGWSGRLQRDAPEIDGHVRIEAETDKPGVDRDSGVDLLVGKFAQVDIIGAYPYELAARWTGKSW